MEKEVAKLAAKSVVEGAIRPQSRAAEENFWLQSRAAEESFWLVETAFSAVSHGGR